MDEEKTFEWDDFNDEFWKKVVFFRIEYGSAMAMTPGLFEIVTIDNKIFCMDPEVRKWKDLHPMFSYEYIQENGRNVAKFQIEDEGWQSIKEESLNGFAYIRGDLYDDYKREVKDKVYYSTAIVERILGVEHLERYIEINTKKDRDERRKRAEEWREERERSKFLPEHLIWKQMHENNMTVNPICGEYAVIVSRREEKLVAMKFTIVYQPYCVGPMTIEPNKGVERYVLFEKTYYDFYGPLDYPLENWGYTRYFAFYDWVCLNTDDMRSYGSFLCSFSTAEEAKKYALCYLNSNSHIVGDRNTLVTHLDPEEEHKMRIERYEAYQAYRKYYKEILEAVINYDGYPSAGCGGEPFLMHEILRKVPQITERQLNYFFKDVPLVLEKRTQDYIEIERQKSIEMLQK